MIIIKRIEKLSKTMEKYYDDFVQIKNNNYTYSKLY